MNSFTGIISEVQQSGSLSLVSVLVKEQPITCIVIDTAETAAYLRKGSTVKVLFKETEVIIGMGEVANISLQNKIAGSIVHMEKGQLLCKLVVQTNIGEVVSVITSKSAESLQLQTGLAVTAMVKTNEILLSA